ncbi:MAG TPA: DUF5652 family protein [Candidatus Nanoarchaeia archaeon]|nr:DUF5652 family protein [Candidatus Nanoarchaeia archaeon]
MNFLAQLQSAEQPAFLDFINQNPAVFALIVIWALVWKGLALWKAARLSHKWWFVIILVANTAGILEIIYLFLIARKYTVEEQVEE